MSTQHTITLYRTAQCWMSRSTDPEVRELFGTDTLPTAFGAQVDAATVLTGIRRLNPDCDVTVHLDLEQQLKTEAVRKLTGYLAMPSVAGLFVQAWDRLNAAGLDVDLRREPTEQNARALLWIAENR